MEKKAEKFRYEIKEEWKNHTEEGKRTYAKAKSADDARMLYHEETKNIHEEYQELYPEKTFESHWFHEKTDLPKFTCKSTDGEIIHTIYVVDNELPNHIIAPRVDISTATRVLGFPLKEEYTRARLDKLNAKYLFELACEDEDVVIYDNLFEFFQALNADMIDTEEHWWYMV